MLNCYFAYGMSEPKISEFVTQFGIVISAGQISNLLIKNQTQWHDEKAAIVRTGLGSTNYQHMDPSKKRASWKQRR